MEIYFFLKIIIYNKGNTMKKFDNPVRWDFKISISGYGKDVKQAIIDASRNLQSQAERDFHKNDFESIEEHEVISIDLSDIKDKETTKSDKKYLVFEGNAYRESGWDSDQVEDFELLITEFCEGEGVFINSVFTLKNDKEMQET